MDDVRGIVVVSFSICTLPPSPHVNNRISRIPLHCRYLYTSLATRIPAVTSAYTLFLALDNSLTQSFAMSQLTYSPRPSHALDLWSLKPNLIPIAYPVLSCPTSIPYASLFGSTL